MSENTLRTALRRLGYSNEEMTPHGFRAMARTIMVERLAVTADVIEAQVAHIKSGPVGAAYDRAEYMQQRKEMMDRWASFLLPDSTSVESDGQTRRGSDLKRANPAVGMATL